MLVYSFRFLKLGLVQLSCQLFYIIYVGDTSNLRRFVRFNIQGENDFVPPEGGNWLSDSDESHGPWHPLEKLLDLFVDVIAERIDRSSLRSSRTSNKLSIGYKMTPNPIHYGALLFP